MGVGILAPVPAALIRSALETFERERIVAFGTNAIEVFEKAIGTYGYHLPVIIQPTVRYGDPDGYGRITFSAKLVRFTRANDRGVHPDPRKRPAVTLSTEDPETPCRGFWEVGELGLMPARVALGSMTAEGKKTPLPPTFILHGPLIVTASFL